MLSGRRSLDHPGAPRRQTGAAEELRRRKKAAVPPRSVLLFRLCAPVSHLPIKAMWQRRRWRSLRSIRNHPHRLSGASCPSCHRTRPLSCCCFLSFLASVASLACVCVRAAYPSLTRATRGARWTSHLATFPSEQLSFSPCKPVTAD